MNGDSSASARFVVEGSLTIRNIEESCRKLRDLIEGHAAIEVDASRATEVDVSGIQLVLAARASARKAGKSLTVATPLSRAFHDALAQGGFLAAGESNSFWPGEAVA
jgi:hypothetical protein